MKYIISKLSRSFGIDFESLFDNKFILDGTFQKTFKI